MNLRSRLFKTRHQPRKDARKVKVERLRDVLDVIRETSSGLIHLNKPLSLQDNNHATRYGGSTGSYLSLHGEGKPYELFNAACKPEGVAVGTQWRIAEGIMTVPLVEQVEGALLWWFETHKYPLEASAVQLERLVSEAKQIPLELPTNVEQNGSTYDGKVSSRTVGDPMHELSLHGIPVIEETAVENWRKLSWGRGKTQYANILESGQPGDGVRQRFLTAEAIAFLYKVAWVEAQVGNAVPREYSVLLRPTKKTLSLYAGIGRVRIGGSTLLRYERSLLLGAALREHWKEPWAVFHQSHKIENIPQKEMLKIYSSSGL